MAKLFKRTYWSVDPKTGERVLKQAENWLDKFKDDLGVSQRATLCPDKTLSHSLRHTYLSRLGCSGASPKVMQMLARHSTVELTLGRYTHAGLFDLSSAVNALPPLPLADAPQNELAFMRATGTDSDTGATPQVSGPSTGPSD